MRKFFASALAAFAMVAAVPATAATVILNSGATHSNGGLNYVGSDGTNVRVTGWSVLGGHTIEQVTPGVFGSGIGVQNSNENSSGHVADNRGSLDFFILQFDEAVTLGEATFRTNFSNNNFNDTDSTIGFALSALPFGTDFSLTGGDLSSLSFFSQYESTAPNGNSTRNINTAGNVGNVWLVAPSFINHDGRADGYKLKQLAYTVTPVVPEPGTWLMMILGFGLIGSVMRQKKTGRAAVAA